MGKGRRVRSQHSPRNEIIISSTHQLHEYIPRYTPQATEQIRPTSFVGRSVGRSVFLLPPRILYLSQEVIRRWILHGCPPRLVRRGVEYLEILPQILVQLEYARDVPAPVAVIGRAPHRHQRVVEHAAVPLHDELMGPRDEIEIVPLVEHGHHVPPEEVSGTPGGQPPPVDLLGVAPHQVAHGTVVRYLLLPIDDAYLIEGVHARAQSAVHREYPVLDDRGEAEVVEYFRAVSPHVDAPVLPEALVVEAVHLGDLAALVIPPYEGDPIGISHLERQQQEEGLDGVVAAIDEVAEEEVVGVGTLAPHLEELDQVVELAVDVAADLEA